MLQQHDLHSHLFIFTSGRYRGVYLRPGNEFFIKIPLLAEVNVLILTTRNKFKSCSNNPSNICCTSSVASWRSLSYLTLVKNFKIRCAIQFIQRVFALFPNIEMNNFSSDSFHFQSVEISETIYGLPWYDDPSLQKDIKMMLVRSQKNLCLTAGSFGIMSFDTLKLVTQHSSYQLSTPNVDFSFRFSSLFIRI